MTTPQQQPFAPGPAGYGTPAAQPVGYGPPAPRWNVMSIVALVAAFFIPLAAVICGWVSVRQIARTGEQGRGLAITALVLGGIGCAFWVLFWVLIIANGGSFSYSYSL
ncbi:DUF4190 domain-containing protein [Actinomycetospora termitidis]|uniref:DUF4190 domain-containing protein n=1 Tax=Actinomycetospora termitidis TaxID=3053470 RepID=A0ABT7MFA2_9PSEU|nr:DUF4190 domain-containing protein [Actinomycetospora sp. Odt1-22]MDL5159353.1 DUF4190 domain-containing protein [Actinomycetospora sp. Odt1-22]